MNAVHFGLALALAALGGSVLAHGDEAHSAQARPYDASKVEARPFGREGDPKKVARTIKVDMSDTFRFTPADVVVKRGETVKFLVSNSGKQLHEMVLGTAQELREHAELMKKFPGMEHADANMAHVKCQGRNRLAVHQGWRVSVRLPAPRPLRGRNDWKGRRQMNRRNALSLALGAMALTAAPTFAAGALPTVEVFKNPSCGCCGAWVDHLKAAGFDVKVTMTEDTSVVRRKYGLPDRFGSCHTAVVAGYVVEGHVPAADVKKLLSMKPVAVGIAVPGMPVGSPGMEMGSRKDPYQVLLVDKNGRERVFSSYS